MAEHHALRETGGAARVQDRGQIRAAAHCILGWWGAGDQFLVAERTCGRGLVAGIDDGAHAGRLLADRVDQRQVLVVDDQHLAVAIDQ